MMMYAASATTLFLVVVQFCATTANAADPKHVDAPNFSAVTSYFKSAFPSTIDFAVAKQQEQEEERCPCSAEQLQARERFRQTVYVNCKKLSAYVMEGYANDVWSAADGFSVPAMVGDPFKCNSLLSSESKAPPEMCECPSSDNQLLATRLKQFRTCMHRPRWLSNPLGGFYKAPDCSQHLRPKDFDALNSKEKSSVERNFPQFYEQAIAKRGSKSSLGF